MIINRIYENQKPSVAVACFLLGRAKDLSAPLYILTVKLDTDLFGTDMEIGMNLAQDVLSPLMLLYRLNIFLFC